MKLFEKLKNTFFEEEYVEVEEPKEEIKKEEKKEEPKKEEVAKKVEVKEEPKKEEVIEEIEDDDDEIEAVSFEEDNSDDDESETIYSDREILSRNSKLSYFDEDDFVDEYYEEKKEVIKPVEETKKIYGGSASSVYDSIINSESEHRPYGESSGKFHPTPIISPIYGVLDKNYRKEEVVDKKDRPSSYVSKRDMDLDSIRKKAYGDVSILDTKVDTEDEEIDNEPLLYDMIDNEADSKPEVDKVTIADAEEYFEDLGLEYNVDYKDTSYEEATRSKTRSTRAEKHQNDEDEELSNTLTDLEVPTDEELYDNNIDEVPYTNVEDDSYDDSDENLFDLVDSVYKGGEE